MQNGKISDHDKIFKTRISQMIDSWKLLLACSGGLNKKIKWTANDNGSRFLSDDQVDNFCSCGSHVWRKNFETTTKFGRYIHQGRKCHAELVQWTDLCCIQALMSQLRVSDWPGTSAGLGNNWVIKHSQLSVELQGSSCWTAMLKQRQKWSNNNWHHWSSRVVSEINNHDNIRSYTQP